MCEFDTHSRCWLANPQDLSLHSLWIATEKSCYPFFLPCRNCSRNDVEWNSCPLIFIRRAVLLPHLTTCVSQVLGLGLWVWLGKGHPQINSFIGTQGWRVGRTRVHSTIIWGLQWSLLVRNCPPWRWLLPLKTGNIYIHMCMCVCVCVCVCVYVYI